MFCYNLGSLLLPVKNLPLSDAACKSYFGLGGTNVNLLQIKTMFSYYSGSQNLCLSVWDFDKSTGDGVSRAFRATLSVLEKRECTVYFLKDTPRPVVPEKYSLLEISEFADNCDLVISVGGDGTLLHTAGLLYPKDVALMGINLGRLGFLTDLQPERVTTELDAILGGAFQTEKGAF